MATVIGIWRHFGVTPASGATFTFEQTRYARIEHSTDSCRIPNITAYDRSSVPLKLLRPCRMGRTQLTD